MRIESEQELWRAFVWAEIERHREGLAQEVRLLREHDGETHAVLDLENMLDELKAWCDANATL